MSTYALIEISTGMVVNTIVLDESSSWTDPDGYITIQTDVASTGWSYVDGVFSPPPIPPLTPDEIFAANQMRQSSLLAQASQPMTAILIALQLDATDSVTVSARAWRNYYQALQAVDLTVEDPAWPSAPDQ